MLQVYLVRHGETQWNAERRIQGQSDSPLTAKGEQQAMQVATRAKELGITHIISSDLGRTRRTAEIIAQACGCDIIFDSRLRELNMGVLEKRHIDSLTEEEENFFDKRNSSMVNVKLFLRFILVMAIYVKNKTKAVKKQAEAFICGL